MARREFRSKLREQASKYVSGEVTFQSTYFLINTLQASLKKEIEWYTKKLAFKKVSQPRATKVLEKDHLLLKAFQAYHQKEG